jgi:HNH endonuclease
MQDSATASTVELPGPLDWFHLEPAADPQVPERFLEKVNFDGPIPELYPWLGPCHLWTGCRNNKGYGRFRVDGRSAYAHIWLFEEVFGPIARPLEPDHLCRVHACVNVQHLEVVTHSVNLLRGDSPNRRKTHCLRGHPFDEANTRLYRGGRVCRACERDRAGGGDGLAPALRTHCPQGHPYDEANTYWTPAGTRHCRACNRDRMRRRRAAR